MKNKLISIIIKLFIVIALFECVYLFAVPVLINKYVTGEFIKNISEEKTNLSVDCLEPRIRTHILPFVSLESKNVKIADKNDKILLLEAKNPNLRISILPLVLKAV